MTTALARAESASMQLGLADLHMLGKTLLPTGFLPATIKTPEQALAIMLKGQELGIPAMYALSNITVIQGKPTANAELMLALIYRDHGDDAIDVEETTNTACTISYKRRKATARRSYTYTIEDARKAGLTSQTWQKYPAAMLRARCISAVARYAFPDTIAGMYTPEELGATVDPDTGEITEVSPPPQAEQVQPQTRSRLDRVIDRLMVLEAEYAALDGFHAPRPRTEWERMDDAALYASGQELTKWIADAKANAAATEPAPLDDFEGDGGLFTEVETNKP
jgi:hypothetical protein